MRVLFVDDEPRVLGGIENALIFDGDDMQAMFATSGEAAVATLGESEFDVIVTDMKMPGMTGADVLEFAREHRPAVARVVLSGEVDPELAQRAMPLTHEFVTKPCEPARLFDIVRGVHDTVRSLDSPIINDLVCGMALLPVQPRIFTELQTAIEREEGLSALANIIETDLAISTAVLRAANSAFYGFRTPANSIREASSRLGSVAISGIALNAELADGAPVNVIAELETLNNLAVNVARVVRGLIGEEIPQASLAALLRSIGVVVLQTNLTEQFRPLQIHFNETGEVDEDAERRILGATHAEIGAYVLRMWKVDSLVVEAVRFHGDVTRATTPEAIRMIHAMAAAEAAISGERNAPDWICGDLVRAAQQILDDSP